MVHPKFGEVYIVRFHPSLGSELKRFRPAVVASDAISVCDPRFTLIVPLTTHTKSRNEFELPVSAKFLDKESLILSWYLYTVDNVRLQQKLGTLNSTTLVLLRSNLRKLF
jgi:mRNA interferase MazF